MSDEERGKDVPPEPGEMPQNDYQSGYAWGKNDGWSHRDFAPPEHQRDNEDFLRGYRDGYRKGREHPKPRGQLPPRDLGGTE